MVTGSLSGVEDGGGCSGTCVGQRSSTLRVHGSEALLRGVRRGAGRLAGSYLGFHLSAARGMLPMSVVSDVIMTCLGGTCQDAYEAGGAG